MKKICYLLCMICTLGAFNACSDDDDNMDPSVPVTEIVVPAKVQAGSELIIAGNGFAKDCKIILKNDAQSQELTVAERLSASIACTVPTTLAPGEYTVILVQAGEWPLRKITVLEEGAVDPNAPVTSLMLPKGPVTAGEEVTIQGLGFAKNCEILLKVGEEWQKMEIIASNTDVKFTLPANFATGVYPVKLKQDGGEWTIGEISVEAKAVEERNRIDKITEKWSKKNTDHEIVNSYIYDEQGRLARIDVVYDGEKSNRTIFTWTEGMLKVNDYYYNPDAGDYDAEPYISCTYTLAADGTVTHSEYIGRGAYSSDWEYDAQGYLNILAANYTYSMVDNYLNVYSDGMYEYKFVYANEQANRCVIDLMGEVLFRMRIESEELYYARIAGISGAVPGLLPSSIISLGETPEDNYELGSIEYDTYPDDYISKLTFDDGHTLEVTYK